MADDIDTEIAEIEGGMAEDNAAYWNDPAKQERYGQLLEAREAGEQTPPAPDKNAARRGELQEMMGDQHSPYWKGPPFRPPGAWD